MADWNVTKGDYGWTQEFTVKDANGDVKDLTGYTVTLKVWDSTGLKFSGSCDLNADPKTGKCTYSVKNTDFSDEGDFLWILVLTKTGEQITTNACTVSVGSTAPS